MPIKVYHIVVPLKMQVFHQPSLPCLPTQDFQRFMADVSISLIFHPLSEKSSLLATMRLGTTSCLKGKIVSLRNYFRVIMNEKQHPNLKQTKTNPLLICHKSF